MPDISMPKATRAHAEKRHALAPGPDDAFHAFSKAVFAPGALDAAGEADMLAFVEKLLNRP